MLRSALVLPVILNALFGVLAEAVRGRGNRAHRFLALRHDLQPGVIAHSLAKVEEDWRLQALASVESNSVGSSIAGIAAADHMNASAPKKFQRSCGTVVSAVLQASSGDREAVQQYLDDVCSQDQLRGWRSEQCHWLTEVVTVAMTADEYVNREELDTADVCRHLWLRISREERARAIKEAKQKAAEEAAREAREEAAKKAAALAARKAAAEAKRKAAEEAAKRAKEEAAKKVEEEAAKRAEESARKVKAEARKKAAEDAAMEKIRQVREDTRKKVEEQTRREHQERQAARKKAAEKKLKQASANAARQIAEAKRREEKTKKAVEAKRQAEQEARKLEDEAEHLQQKVVQAISDDMQMTKPANTGKKPKFEQHK